MRWRRITGGKALFDYNDFIDGESCRPQKAISSYYVIGYYTTNTALDGKFRKIAITRLRNSHRPSSNFRQGYFAGQGVHEIHRHRIRSGSLKMR